MNRYQWQAGSAIESVAIRRDQAYPTAYLFASDQADASLYAELPDQLRQTGLQVIADTLDGKPVLRVNGFTHDAQIINALRHAGVTQGTQTLTEREPDKPFKLGGWVKENSAVAAGMTYLVADSMTYASGYLRKDWAQIRQGMLFGSTSVLLTLLGTPDPQKQMERVYRKLEDYMEAEGVPMEQAERQLLSERSEDRNNVIRRLTNFLSDHLVTINNVGQGLGGFEGLRAGMNQKNEFKMASGVAIMAGQWGALGIKEDLTAGMDAEEREKYFEAQRKGEKAEVKHLHLMTDPVDWFKQKPLRLTGLGAGLHNVLTFSGGLYEQMKLKDGQGKYQSKRGAWIDMSTQGVNLVANTLYGLSPKDRRGFLKEDGYIDELTSIAAQIFCHSQGEEREMRISQFVGYMSSVPEVKSSAQELDEAIHEKMDLLAKNPWHMSAHTQMQQPQMTIQQPIAHEQLALAQQSSTQLV